MNIYDNNKELLATLGITGEFSTDFEVRKAILTALGGDASNVNSIYEADIKILDIYKNGGGAGGGDCSELEAQIQALEAEVAALETENNTLEASNTQLESQIASISTLSVTENGTYTPEAGILGWNNVEVNVAGGGGSGVLEVQNEAQLRCNNTELPFKIDSSGVTNFTRMFYNCTNLTTVPQLDTSNGTNFGYMFAGCNSLTTIPQLDTAKGMKFDSTFRSNRNITSINITNTSKCNNSCYEMFAFCNNLVTINGDLDFTKASDITDTFLYCISLKDLTFIGSLNKTLSLQYCPLTKESVISVLTACSNTTNTTAKTLRFQSSGLTFTDTDGTLAALVADCTSKGWTISGLTLM